MPQAETTARPWPKSARLSPLLLGLLLWGGAAVAATTVDLATGVGAGIGVASDPVHNDVYYVEFGSGSLKRIHIDPGCDLASPATCTISTVASGFSHPEDVALDVDHGLAYVTTRDDPGTTGALWRVDLASGVRSLVTFNLGAPHQIALDTAADRAYVVGFDSGKLWKVNLTTGAKVAVMTGLGHPVGLVLNADRSRAYVTEQTPARLAEIDPVLHTRVRNVVTGLTSPFYLAWTDPAQFALYVVERDPANQVKRVDLPSSTATPVVTGLPFRPSGIAVNLAAGAAYVTTNDKVVKVLLGDLPMSEPVFLGVGLVPSSRIVDGYATTDPTYILPVKDAPFGGTLSIMGNLSNFKALGATHYRVSVSYEGAAPATPLSLSWNTYRWNTVTSEYELVPVSPVPGAEPTSPATPGDDVYEIPPEYPAHAQRWYPAFLMMRWPSGVNGHYTFGVEIFKQTGAAWTNLTSSLTSGNSLTVLVDNTPASIDVVAIRQHGTTAIIGPCTIVSTPPVPPPSKFDVQVTAHDANGHLHGYTLKALWGHNASAVVSSDSYASHVDADGPHLWNGVSNAWVPAAGWPAACNCAHTFYLEVLKRTIDGYTHILSGTAHQSITINNTGITCP